MVVGGCFQQVADMRGLQEALVRGGLNNGHFSAMADTAYHDRRLADDWRLVHLRRLGNYHAGCHRCR